MLPRMTVTVHPFNQGFGAELRGIDLSQPMTQQVFDAWKAALAEHPVLVLRDQFFTDRQHVEFSRWFGELEEFPDPKDWAADDLPWILRVSNVDRRSNTIKDVDEPGHKSFTLGTGDWHIDSSYLKKMCQASLLYAREVPPSGGDTMFANMQAAYAALPEEKKREIEGLVVIHDFNHTRVRLGLPSRPPEVRAKTPPVRHPIAHRLPDGSRSLLLGSHIHTIVGMDEAKAQALLAELTEWAIQPRFTYRHKWRVGDLVMWDNTRTMHRAMPYELANARRVLQRTTVAGVEPVA
jgi:taurine dioxygenase/alpha-ketoglutarate-dependent 2,4-dichlorophenoxyacetate dioxygenase